MQTGNFPSPIFNEVIRQRGAVIKIIRIDGIDILIITFHFANDDDWYAIRIQRAEKRFICR